MGRMRGSVLLTALLALASGPGAWAVWLGRLDPQQVGALFFFSFFLPLLESLPWHMEFPWLGV